MIYRSLLHLLMVVSAVNLFAADILKDRVVVELSQPDQPGLLRINHYKGSITVHAYNGRTVIVNAAYRENNTGTGLQRLNNRSLELSAVEQNNEVTVHTDSQRRTIDLDILVPRQFALKLQTYDNGEIEVTDVVGELDITNTNGPVRLLRISGSAMVTTVDGDILVKFKEIRPDIPMAFTSIEGDIDITFPESANGRLKMKADNGDVFADTGIEINKERYSGTRKSAGFVPGNWSMGVLNQGGAEYLIKSMNGNIYIRQNKNEQ